MVYMLMCLFNVLVPNLKLHVFVSVFNISTVALHKYFLHFIFSVMENCIHQMLELLKIPSISLFFAIMFLTCVFFFYCLGDILTYFSRVSNNCA